MKIGVAVPNIGPVATPEAVKTVAQRAEALGYHIDKKLDLFPMHAMRFQIAYLEGDSTEMDRQAAWMKSRTSPR